MKHLTLSDAVDVTKPRRTKDGYLVAEAHVARTGIQQYLAGELGFDGDPMRVVNVFRPPEEVFSKDAMASYAHRPLTVDHPPVLVDAANWKQFARGQTGDEVMRDGELVRVPLMLMDEQAIQDWQDGKKELSMGYTMDLDLTAGETADGQAYEAVQRNLRMNHLALVARARGGSQLKLGDNQPEESTVQTKTIMVDGLSVETTEAGAQAIAKLLGDVASARTDLETAKQDQTSALAAKDAELAKRDAEIDSLKSKVLDEAALDSAVRVRSDLIAKAEKIAAKDYTGLSPADIRKAAVTAKLGTEVVDGKSPEYIEARFDILAEEASADPVRSAVRAGDTGGNRPNPNKAFDDYISDTANAWKNNHKEAH